MPVPLGTWIAGRYRVDAFLGSGTFGEVHRVFDDHQGQDVALKLLDPAHTGPWPWNEPTQLTRLRSDYILPVWNADVVAGVAFVVTEIATHGTLGDLVSTGPLRPSVATLAIRHASRGAARTHDDGVVHRDIKPDNLFIGSDGRVLLGDFGLAHPLDANGEAPWGGTPGTMAPEVILGGPTTVATDVYSLGATLYAALTGEYPYEAHCADLPTLQAAVTAGPPTPVRDLAPIISRSLTGIVETAMHSDPNRRYTAVQLDAALGRLTFARQWVVTSHPGHDRCWEAPHNSGWIQVCVINVGRRHEVVVSRQPSGLRIRKHCSSNITAAALAGRLRRIFEALGN